MTIQSVTQKPTGVVNYGHLGALTDARGIFEHSEYSQPRLSHGYCVDDVARALIVVARDQNPDARLHRLAGVYISFLDAAQSGDGLLVNRCDTSGTWSGPADTGDHWGRALWAWGTLISHCRDEEMAALAYERFLASGRQRSSHLRSMMFASLGAFEVLKVLPGNKVALRLVADAVDLIPVSGDHEWPWPEERLSYANAAVPEVLINAGCSLSSPSLTRRGLSLLDWLIEIQTVDGHLSVTPAGGLRRASTLPQFDQQPIEVAALADASATAFNVTGDERWRKAIEMSALWFKGANDLGIQMHDPSTGAGYDGLTPEGRNENQGAESTLAYLSTMQQWNRCCIGA